MKTLLLTIDELNGYYPRPINKEHGEAFLLRKYRAAVALVCLLWLDGAISDQGHRSFPTITNGAGNYARLCKWSLRFEQWRQHLGAHDELVFSRQEFDPKKLQ